MRKFVCLPSDEKIKEEKDFLIREGEFSECLAAKHRISGCEAAWLETSEPYANHTTLSENIVKISNVF